MPAKPAKRTLLDESNAKRAEHRHGRPQQGNAKPAKPAKRALLYQPNAQRATTHPSTGSGRPLMVSLSNHAFNVRTAAPLCALAAALWLDPQVAAQRGRGGQPAGPPPTPKAAAPVDLSGYWVALVTDDWRWRMVTPPKGDVLY